MYSDDDRFYGCFIIVFVDWLSIRFQEFYKNTWNKLSIDEESMFKQWVVIGLLGLSSISLWGGKAEAWNIGGISYRPGGSYVCEVEIKAETHKELKALKRGQVTVVCDQFVQKHDLHGICQSPKGDLFSSKPFDFQGQIETRVKFSHDCKGATCTAASVQVSTIDDIEALLGHKRRQRKLPDVCDRHDTAAECIEKVFDVDASKICREHPHTHHYKRRHEKRSIFYGAVFTGINIVAIIKEKGKEVETLEVDCEISESSSDESNCWPTEYKESEEEGGGYGKHGSHRPR
jgi:hypothetical protein